MISSDVEQFERRLSEAKRGYFAIRQALATNRDLRQDARGRVIRQAAREYASEVSQLRAMLNQALAGQVGQTVALEKTAVKKHLETLYAEAERRGQAAAVIAAQIVSMSDVSNLARLYASGDPLIRGLIALVPGRYADTTDAASLVLQTEVEKDIFGEVKAQGDVTRRAESLVAGLDENPESDFLRRKEVLGATIGDPERIDEVLLSQFTFTPQELRAAEVEIMRLLKVEG